MSPDGKSLVTSGEMDLTVHVWDAATGKEVRHLRANGDNLATPLAFSPDGTLLAAGYCHNEGNSILVWDFATGKELRRLEGATLGVEALAFADRGKSIVAFVQIGMAYWWDVKTGKETRRWNAFAELNKAGHECNLYDGGVFSPDATKFVGVVELLAKNGQPVNGAEFVSAAWDMAAGKLLWRDTRGGAGQISPDGKYVTVSREKAIALCDLLTGKEVRRLPLAEGFRAGHTHAFSRDGKRLIVLSRHEPAQVWDITTGKLVIQFPLIGWGPQDAREYTVTFFPDDARILLTADNQLFIWNTRTGKEVLPWLGHRQPITHLAFSADGKRLRSGVGSWRFPHEQLTWDTKRWQEVGRSVLPEDDLWRHPVPASPDHRLAIVLRKGGALYLHGRAARKDMRKLEAALARTDVTESSFFSPNGQLAVLDTRHRYGREHRRRLIDVESGRTVCDLPATAAKRRLTFAPDNRHVAWVGADARGRLLDVATGRIVWRFGKPDKERRSIPGALAFSPDGLYLASWDSRDYAVRVWALRTGKLRRLLPNSAGFPNPYRPLEWPAALAFAPDGKTLAVSFLGEGNGVGLWELATARRRLWLRGHVMPVTALAFSPDGRRLASGSADTTVLVWDLAGR